MATAGIMDGTLWGLYVASTLVAGGTSCKLKINMATRKSSNKDTGAFEGTKPGRISWGLSGSAQMAQDAAYGFRDLFAAMIARSAVAVKVSTEVTGDYTYGGNGYIVDLPADFSDLEDSTFDVEIEGDGVIAETVISA